MKIYKVGGCVRDQLMGIEPRDIDWLVVGATPSELESQGYQRVGADFPVFLHPVTKDEYALARKERKTSAGHKGFETVFDTSVTLEQDLSRRDLTINAMAIDAETGEISDPYGGRADLAAKTLRHVSEAFSEDPLRVMRLARFQARTGFSVAPQTMELCRQICQSGALLELSPERICQELRKMFESPRCSQGMASLLECAALAAIDPTWPARLGGPQLAALDLAAQAPEWAKARLACCQGLGSDASAKFMEGLRFPSEVSKACARLGAFHTWAKTIDPDALDSFGAAAELERCGASRLKDADRQSFGLAAQAELAAAGVDPRAIALAMSALAAAKAISEADLASALSGPKGSIPEAVKRAKAEAFDAAWSSMRLASDAPEARPKPVF